MAVKSNPFFQRMKPPPRPASFHPTTPSSLASTAPLSAPSSSVNNPFLHPPPSYASVVSRELPQSVPLQTANQNKPASGINPFMTQQTAAKITISSSEPQTDSHQTSPALRFTAGPKQQQQQQQSSVAVRTVTQKPLYDPRRAALPLGQTRGALLPNNATLHVKEIPPQFNTESFLEEHFSKFGVLKSVRCNTAKMYATAVFETQVTSCLVVYMC